MFIEFKIGNFRSFRDIQTFSMQAASLRPNDGGLEEGNVFIDSNKRLLKTKAIFGANASGKSNLAKALGAFILMVNRSVSEEQLCNRIWEERFQMVTDWDSEPVFFQYTFSIEGIIYRYGFQILKNKVIYEWLFEMHEGDEIEYFMRNSEGININNDYLVGADLYIDLAKQKDNEVFRPDSLFLTSAAISGNKTAAKFRKEIIHIIGVDGINDEDAIQFAMAILDDGTDQQKMALQELLRAADTGIEKLELMDIPESIFKRSFPKEQQEQLSNENRKRPRTIFSYHSVYNDKGNVEKAISVPFYDWESEGTSKLLGIGALVLQALLTGRTMIIDEFDARFHSNLSLKIVDLFNSPSTNALNSQLIFISHDAGLLRRAKLRRDQICIVNKSKFGFSTLKTLIEYKGVRKDASYEKEYLEGSYDGVPNLAELDWIITQNFRENGLSTAK